MHPLKINTQWLISICFFTVKFLKIFVTETNNYTKKFLQAHTDLPNSKARYWKTLTFAELKGFVACLINTGGHAQPTIALY